MIQILKKIPAFACLAPDDAQHLVDNSELRRYPAGGVVLSEGDTGDVVFIILKGRVKVVLTHAGGKEIILTILKAGNYFGEMTAFDSMPRSATIIAEDDCKFLVIPHTAIKRQIRQNPQIALDMLCEMSRRVREANEQINNLAHLDVKGRVAKMLLRLSAESRAKTRAGYAVIPRPAMRDMAAMSGTSRETVSRILNGLMKRGVIGLSKDTISIFEPFETNNE